MKPMLLKIKGINSFQEEQTIDFNELTQGGLFGIFGPTGSGKSTILDGITLALFGKISRNSTNYINVNEEKASVFYEFIISGTEQKTYQVSREFRRNKNEGINQGKCQFLEIKSEGTVVLADKSGDVTKCCEDIIGLSLTDFTRTVVLPQGKFSDFLKLEGKPRREMLERLFNLSKYGDDLTIRLKAEKIRETEKLHRLEGSISAYEGVSAKVLEEKTIEFEENHQNLLKGQQDYENNTLALNEAETLWGYHQELKTVRSTANELISKKSEINEMENQLNQGRKAQAVAPAMEDLKSLYQEITELDQMLKMHKEGHLKLISEKSEAEKSWEKIAHEKDEELPKLKDTLSRLIDAIDLKTVENRLVKENNEIIEKLSIFNEKTKQFEKERNLIFQDLERKKASMLQDVEEEKKLRVAVDYREKINQGSELIEKIKSLENEININLIRLDENKLEIEHLETKRRGFNEKRETTEGSISYYKEKLSAHKNAPPGTREELERLRVEADRKRNLWEKQKSFTESIKKQTLNIQRIDEAIERKNSVREQLVQEYENLKRNIVALQNINLGARLRDQLLAGEPCPVCGSKDHPNSLQEMPEDSDKLNAFEKDQLQKENTLKAVTNEISELTGSLKAEMSNRGNQVTELNKLGGVVENGLPETLEKNIIALSSAIEKWENQEKEWEVTKNRFEQELLTVSGDIKEKIAEIKSLKKQTEEITDENDQKIKVMITLKKNLDKLSTIIVATDFSKEKTRLMDMDTRRNELVSELETQQKILEQDQKNLDGLNKSITELQGEILKYTTISAEKKKQCQEKHKAVVTKIGENQTLTRLGVLKTEQENTINRINVTWAEQKKKRETLQEAYGKASELVTSKTASLNTLSAQYERNRQSLNRQLSALEFKDMDEVKRSYLTQETMDTMETASKDYHEALTKINGAIESLDKKVNGRELSLEKYTEIKDKNKWCKNNVSELRDQETRLEDEVKHLKIRLEELRGFFMDKEKIDHRLALITDLEKLFAGKKFVEFVAVARLKYISIEASKRLTEISNGNYGLEADADGRFIIRDYKNGGASRDPSTLSGGETFLASLALALALSAEIQLKGRTPLEFFFLDEGFGSLHEDALESVMNSIEMLHHEKLKVGIISHVESIKNRMPVKLLITPAEAGAGGSRVRIER